MFVCLFIQNRDSYLLEQFCPYRMAGVILQKDYFQKNIALVIVVPPRKTLAWVEMIQLMFQIGLKLICFSCCVLSINSFKSFNHQTNPHLGKLSRYGQFLQNHLINEYVLLLFFFHLESAQLI